MTAKPLDIDVQVGARLREIRKDRGMSMDALGRRIGVTYQQIQKYETGRNRISASTLVALADPLDCAPADFLPSHKTASVAVQGSDMRALEDRMDRLPADRRRKVLSAIDHLIAAFEPPAIAA